MSFWGRLESVINSYLNDTDGETARLFRRGGSGDPDLDAAYEEIDDYLNEKDGGKKHAEYSWKDAGGGNSGAGGASTKVKLPPEELRADFECLGVPFGADIETCKAAYKKLLKIHHPDRHAGHEGNFKKATEKSAKINAAWDRIEKWRQDK